MGSCINMILTKRYLIRISITGIALGLTIAAYFVGAYRSRTEIRQTAIQQLHIIGLDVESVLDKYETLPFVLASRSDVEHVLTHTGNIKAINRLNQTLETVQFQAKIDAIFLMDHTGMTVAASTWNRSDKLNYIGKSFSFRPYFRDAMTGIAGQFYAIGSVTSEPGYFISQPVYQSGARTDSTPIGVITVKIRLSEFEKTWISSDDPIALVDHNDVIFLCNKKEWRYHSLHQLNTTAKTRLTATLQYAGKEILALPSDAKLISLGLGSPVIQPINRLGWTLMLFPFETRIMRSGITSASIAALLLAILGSTLAALHQRWRRLKEQQTSRLALQHAADDLERNIVLRTQELVTAKQNLETKYTKLKETEHLLRSTQNELIQAGKLTMLGQMAAGITHELNQPLTAIQAFADNAVTFITRGMISNAQENLTQISMAAARMGSIIAQLKGFARRSNDPPIALDLYDSIHTSALLLQGEFTRCGVELDIMAKRRPYAIGDAVRIEQVLINLLRNAFDATEEQPIRKIFITLDETEAHAVICIRDTGTGIATNVAAHIFEPFFTTKPGGRGLGLGLAISSSIIQAMNGELIARNHPDGGAQFIVHLPKVDT